MGTGLWARVALVTLLACSPLEAASRPNVVFVLADQWRAAATGYAGDPNVKTPKLDQLARQSVNFRNAVSGFPVCSPCRASLLTGQRPLTHGIFLNDAHLSDDAVTLAKVMQGAGYDTGIIGKWHLNGRGRLSFIPRANHQGFDFWRVMECTHDYLKSFYYADDDPERREWEGYDAIAQTRAAQQYVQTHAKGDKPFLLCLWWGPPHNPYNTAPDRFKKMYAAEKLALRANVPEAMAKQARSDLSGYYAHCSALDECLGELRQTLHDAGVEDNTILIFSSDHGDMLWSHGFNRKQQPWDESIRVPMLWHWPAGLGSQNRAVDPVMSSEDVMPTILGLCGIDKPASVEGVDYSGFMKGGENPNPDNGAIISCVSPFSEWSRAMGGKEYRGVRTDRYTYVRELKGPWLLYDNQADPYQRENLIGKAPKLESELNAILASKLKQAGDEFREADYYLTKWGYKDRVAASGALPSKP